MTEKNESCLESRNRLSLEPKNDFSLEAGSEFNSDESSKILTSEQLEDEKDNVRRYLQESGALSIKPNLNYLQVLELLLKFHMNRLTFDDIQVQSIMQCYIQRESTITSWSVLVTRNELKFIKDLREGTYIKSVEEIKCTVCFGLGFVNKINDICYRCEHCLVVNKVDLVLFWGGEIFCASCNHCQILTEERGKTHCTACTTCDGIGFMKKIEFESYLLVLNGNIPVVDIDDETYSSLLSLFKKVNGAVVTQRQGRTEFKNVYEEYLAYKSSISNVALIVVECLIQSKKRRFFMAGEQFEVMQGCDNSDKTESNGVAT